MNLFQLYNKALIIYKDARPSDALSFILKELRKWEQTVIPDETELKMKRMFDSMYSRASLSLSVDLKVNVSKCTRSRPLIDVKGIIC